MTVDQQEQAAKQCSPQLSRRTTGTAGELFTDSTGTIIGAPSTNAKGFGNAANQSQANLANISTGGPAAFWTTYGVNEGSCTGSPPVNCDGLERMDTFANILAAAWKARDRRRAPAQPCSAIPAARARQLRRPTIWPPT
jgi:hypothetical protein